MSEPTAEPPPGAPDSPPPTRLRTWWHPLLVQQLRWLAGPVYEVRDEVPVGRLPLRIDILVLRQRAGSLPPHHQQALAGLLEYWNEHTLIEFKGPTDQLEAGDFRTLLAYAHLYCVQTDPLLNPSRMSLLVVAPRLTQPYRDELSCFAVTPQQERPGIYRLEGAPGYPAWLIETERVAGAEHPLLTLVSPAFLRDRTRFIEALRQAGFEDLVTAMAQQIYQFRRSGPDFGLHHRGMEDMMHMDLDLLGNILRDLSVSERLILLRDLPAEDRRALLGDLSAEDRRALLSGLSAEDRRALLRDLPLEERLAGLSPEQLAQLRNLLPPPPSN